MRRLSLRGKFILTLTVGAVALAVLFGVSFQGTRTLEETFRTMRNRDTVGRIAALDIAKDINFFSRLTRNIMLGSDIEKDLKKIDETAANIERNYTVLAGLDFTPEEKGIIAKAREASIQFTRDGTEIVSGLRGVPVEERHAAYAEYHKRATPFAMAFRENYGAFEKAMNKRFDAGMALMTERIEGHMRLLWIILAGAVLGMYALGYFVSNRDLVAMRRCVEFAEELGGEDVGRVDAERMSSMRDLAQALNATADSLAAFRADVARATGEAGRERDEAKRALEAADEAMRRAESARREGMFQAAEKLRGVVTVVAQASDDLSASVRQSSGGAEHQTRRVNETGLAMGQMNDTVLEVARNASQAAETSGGARQKAQEGAEIVAQVVTVIGQVQRQSLELKDDMLALGREAESIGQVMGVINDIADQTNLLALNAAIEAARAGDAGRGFAVVADEVRKLAEKTMTATKEVGDAIQGIQRGTRQNIEKVDRVASSIDETTRLAGQSGSALAEIVSFVDRSTDQIRAIAAASEEQSASSEQINGAIEEIRRISQETTDAMRQSAQVVGSLAAQARNLETLVEDLRKESNA